MILFEHHDAVFKNTGGLARSGRGLSNVGVEVVEKLMGGLKQVQNELKPGVGRQMDTTRIVFWRRKTRQKVKVRRSISGEDLREQHQDLGQALPVPDWSRAIHWGREQVLASWVGLANLAETVKNILKNRLNSLSNRGRTTRAGDKVRQAGDQANVGLGTNLVQSLGKDLKPAT